MHVAAVRTAQLGLGVDAFAERLVGDERLYALYDNDLAALFRDVDHITRLVWPQILGR